MADNKLTAEEIKKIAKLAMINVDESEVAELQEDLGSILEYVKQISEVEVDSKGYKSHVDLTNVTRADKAGKTLTQEDALSNRKNTARDGSFTITTVLDK